MSAPAELLRAMAKRIEANAEDEFAGCFVVIPPQTQDGRTGDTLEILLIDPQRDPRNFWGTVKTKVEIAHHEFTQNYETPQLGYR